MKKNIYIIIIIFLCFIYKIDVIAENKGVCAGKEVNAYSKYCEIDKAYKYIKNGSSYTNRAAKTSSSDGYIGYAYDIDSTTTLSGLSEYGFCLDPGLSSPFGVDYKYGRELDLSNDYDLSVYKIYQRYVNDVVAGVNATTKNKLLVFADISLRSLTFKNGYAIENSLSSVKTNYLTYKNTIAPYIYGSLTTVGSSFNYNYFAEDSFLEEAKNYYQATMSGGLLWNNPLNITSSIENNASAGTYKFNFNINFGDYFSTVYNNDIGYGKAYFDYYLTVNGQKISEHYTDLFNDFTGDGRITDGNLYNIYATISTDKYNEIVSNDGKIKVELVYKTYHPMSSSNVFINYLNKRTSNSSTEARYQRMVVFSKIEETNNTGESITPNLCKQEGNNFYYMDAIVDINNYIDSCGCSINTDILTTDNKTKYQQKCVSETYNSTLSSCDIDSSRTGNLTRSINSIIKEGTVNGTKYTYCSLNCKETVTISDMMNEYSVLAGKYFELNDYPKLNAQKECNVHINYNEWKTHYLTLLQQQIDAFNEWSYTYIREASNHSHGTCCSGCCGNPCGCCSTPPTHSGSYVTYYLNGETPTETTSNYYCSECSSICSHTTASDSANARAAFETKTDEIKKHFETLKYCNDYLKNLGDTTQYYDFQQELRYYYAQEYSKLGILYNDERPYNVDDSLYKSTPTTDNEKELTNDYLNKNNTHTYNYILDNDTNPNGVVVTGIPAGAFTSSYDIVRNAQYDYEYSPSVEKFTNDYSALITDNASSLINPIKLGYVYDIDSTSMSKSDNENYYEFTAIGEKNMIYKNFKNTDKLKRYCSYEIKNELFSTCSGMGTGCSKLNIVYRSVDPSNIDPNNRLGTEGLKNWDNTKGKTVMKTIEDGALGNNTYNPDKLEYSFTLDSNTLKEIREYNVGKNYDNYLLDCVDEVNGVAGNECLSQFITDANNGTGEIGIKFNNNIEGRNKWKYMSKDDLTGDWIIKNYLREDMSNSMFESLTNQLGGITP